MRIVHLLHLFITLGYSALAQNISQELRERNIDRNAEYLFYLHGGVVTILGDNAINQSVPEWGPYQYSAILDTLASHGFHVISERRMPDVNDSAYVSKIIRQVRALKGAGVPSDHITIVGASAGSHIALLAADRINDPATRYVVIGGCWPDTYKDYTNITLRGHFLSIIEKSDPHGTCVKIFDGRETLSSFREIVLNTGLSHGFIYKGHREWVDPVVDFASQR